MYRRLLAGSTTVVKTVSTSSRTSRRYTVSGDGHVHVLASIRHLDHLLASFALDVEFVTVPANGLENGLPATFPVPHGAFSYNAASASGKPLKPIPCKELDLSLSWQSFDIAHELTIKGIQKYVADYRSTLKGSA